MSLKISQLLVIALLFSGCAEVLINDGPEAEADLKQLWRRIVSNLMTCNTDDHLRNHGFLLTAKGWKLSPAYELNPNPDGQGLNNQSRYDRRVRFSKKKSQVQRSSVLTSAGRKNLATSPFTRCQSICLIRSIIACRYHLASTLIC